MPSIVVLYAEESAHSHSENIGANIIHLCTEDMLPIQESILNICVKCSGAS